MKGATGGIVAVLITSFLWGTTGTAATFAPDAGPLAIGAASPLPEMALRSTPASSTSTATGRYICTLASAYRRSRVTPGVGSTIAWRVPTRRLKSVDLPTLGRPTMATVGFI